jgi:hypothetical protein
MPTTVYQRSGDQSTRCIHIPHGEKGYSRHGEHKYLSTRRRLKSLVTEREDALVATDSSWDGW